MKDVLYKTDLYMINGHTWSVTATFSKAFLESIPEHSISTVFGARLGVGWGAMNPHGHYSKVLTFASLENALTALKEIETSVQLITKAWTKLIVKIEGETHFHVPQKVSLFPALRRVR